MLRISCALAAPLPGTLGLHALIVLLLFVLPGEIEI